jgi:hypothetical protein
MVATPRSLPCGPRQRAAIRPCAHTIKSTAGGSHARESIARQHGRCSCPSRCLLRHRDRRATSRVRGVTSACEERPLSPVGMDGLAGRLRRLTAPLNPRPPRSDLRTGRDDVPAPSRQPGDARSRGEYDSGKPCGVRARGRENEDEDGWSPNRSGSPARGLLSEHSLNT